MSLLPGWKRWLWRIALTLGALVLLLAAVVAIVASSPTLKAALFSSYWNERLNGLRPQLNWGNNESCLQDLAEMGVRFTPLAPRNSPLACGITHGVRVSAFGAVRLTPSAAMTCIEAKSLARWLAELEPVAQADMGSALTGMTHVGTYNCRPIRGQLALLSEHAFGNAIDVKGFRFADGRSVLVSAYGANAPSGTFLQHGAEAACSHFNAVITPRSGGLHADHFHLDRGIFYTCR